MAEYKYKDFSLSFTPHPVTGDISVVTDEKSIAQSIKNIILTNTYEVPFISKQAGNIRQYLFELADPFVAQDAKDNIKYAIENYEPRADIIDLIVNVVPDNNSMDVRLVYRAKTSTENITLQFYIDRVV